MNVKNLLGRLREIALLLPRPDCDWEERPRFEPPGPADLVSRFQQRTGFALPADFQSFLALTGDVVGMSVHNGYWLSGSEKSLFQSFKQDGAPRKIDNAPVILIATDGSGNAFMMSPAGAVWRWDHETNATRLVASSFTVFLARVVADWEAYVGLNSGRPILTYR